MSALTAADIERAHRYGFNGSGVGAGPGFLEHLLDETVYIEAHPEFHALIVERLAVGPQGEKQP